ncbi:hypothetical protein niasHT_015491 [Heterodera trifolii]|uniref:Uncharacterized protein n=1 Tax=Heterodera trifolii TaxID=157864 RepID=A0ABD2L080_9BILA
MPSLSSLPSPVTADLLNYSKNINRNRWNAYPNSEQALMELINDDRAKQNATTAVNLSMSNKTSLQFPRVLSKKEYGHLGDFLRQEHLAGSSQMLCHYRNISSSSDRPSIISLICELGCCTDVSGGCCTLNESDKTASPAYHWVIVLLCLFVLFVFISSLAMFVLYWTNRRRERRLMRRRMFGSEKCFSVLSSPAEGNYVTSSVFTADAIRPIRPLQRPLSPKFWHFFNQQPPPTPNAPNLLRFGQNHQLNHNHHHHHFRHSNHQQQQHHSHSPSSSASSAYHAPVEMFFRSAL